MTENKQTVREYMDGFRVSDHSRILDCLTDDVEWVIPGAFHLHGKEAFDKEIENDAFTGRPVITVTRMTEENDVVIAEGTVQAHHKEHGVLHLAMCDVFEMRGGKIRKLTSFLLPIPVAD
ncbi:MAG TPA: nuclear transport factor 2 family protein [Thermoanaerobaculia bacterium]|jgi:ketosteroid isomerase-like protein|nr:nuclear transport factor 2 family protein [Thermoanaerobaculia bacterium]